MYGHLGLLLTTQQYANIIRRRIQVPDSPWSIHSQKRYWIPDQSSMRGIEGVLFHIASVPNCFNGTYCPSVSSGGPTLSCCLQEDKHNLKRGRHLDNTTTSLNNMQLHYHATIKEKWNWNFQYGIQHAPFTWYNLIMPISCSQAVNLAYVVYAKNKILLQNIQAWSCRSAEFAHGMPWRYIPSSGRTNLQSGMTTKLSATTRNYLVQWSASHF